MEIAEYIYEVVLEPSYKKRTRAYANSFGHIRNKILYATLSQTYPVMEKNYVNRRKLYVDCPSGK